MKFTKSIRKNAADIIFLGMIMLGIYIYFVVYLTPSRAAWYLEMNNQMTIFFQELTSIGR